MHTFPHVETLLWVLSRVLQPCAREAMGVPTIRLEKNKVDQGDRSPIGVTDCDSESLFTWYSNEEEEGNQEETQGE